jgi:hypothetical protein
VIMSLTRHTHRVGVMAEGTDLRASGAKIDLSVQSARKPLQQKGGDKEDGKRATTEGTDPEHTKARPEGSRNPCFTLTPVYMTSFESHLLYEALCYK